MPGSYLLSTPRIDINSENTLPLASPTASDFVENRDENMMTLTHTTPMLAQKKLLNSHGSIMRNNVARFIQDHRLGSRHGKDDATNIDVTTAIDSKALISDTTSGANWMMSSRRASQNRQKSHPKSQMLNLSFKKILEK